MTYKKGQWVAICEDGEWSFQIIDAYERGEGWKLEERRFDTFDANDLDTWQATPHGILAMLLNINERLDTLENQLTDTQKDVAAVYRKFIGDRWD